MAAIESQPDSYSKRIVAGMSVGFVAGIVEMTCTYPTEYVKVQQQLDAGRPAGKKHFTGMMDIIKRTFNPKPGKFTPLRFYRGVSPVLLFAGPKTGIRLAIFDGVLTRWIEPGQRPSIMQSMGAGLVAGAVEAAIVVTPAETIKTKFIHDSQRKPPRYKGLFHGIRAAYGELGRKGLYSGLSATIGKQATNQMMRFGTVAVLKSHYTKNVSETIPLYMSVLFGFTAGGVSVIGNTPIDVIKTKMQAIDGASYNNSWECAKSVWKNEGFFAFYSGMQARLARVCLSTAITFGVFDTLKPATKRAVDTAWKKAGWD